jgi:hypothetical protein
MLTWLLDGQPGTVTLAARGIFADLVAVGVREYQLSGAGVRRNAVQRDMRKWRRRRWGRMTAQVGEGSC